MSVPEFIGYSRRAHSLTPQQLAQAREVATALSEGRDLIAGRGGSIAVAKSTTEKGQEDEQGQRQGLRRSQPAREGRQGASGGTGQSRPAVHAGTLLRRELAGLAGVAELRKHYPGTRRFPETGGSGVWLAVPISPLGDGGPQAFSLLAVPFDPDLRILAWAFWCRAGKAEWIGPKHTNYPDGSVCAFPAQAGIWHEALGLTVLIDRHAEWIMRHLILDLDGLWMGRQEGASRYYRLKHTHPQESCTRCCSLRPYENCCRSVDEREYSEADRIQFLHNYRSDVGEQRPPDVILKWAQAGGKPPRMRRAHPELAPLLG